MKFSFFAIRNFLHHHCGIVLPTNVEVLDSTRVRGAAAEGASQCPIWMWDDVEESKEKEDVTDVAEAQNTAQSTSTMVPSDCRRPKFPLIFYELALELWGTFCSPEVSAQNYWTQTQEHVYLQDVKTNND